MTRFAGDHGKIFSLFFESEVGSCVYSTAEALLRNTSRSGRFCSKQLKFIKINEITGKLFIFNDLGVFCCNL